MIEFVNQWLRNGKLQVEGMKPIAAHSIEMSPDVSATVNFVSKLDRSADFIDQLMADGEAQAEDFLARRLSGELVVD